MNCLIKEFEYYYTDNNLNEKLYGLKLDHFARWFICDDDTEYPDIDTVKLIECVRADFRFAYCVKCENKIIYKKNCKIPNCDECETNKFIIS